MLLITTNDLINLINESLDLDTVKQANLKVVTEFEASNAESYSEDFQGIKIYFKDHVPIISKGITMSKLFRPNYN